ncbi:MAG: hypothetical protein J6L87_00610 [Clostridia bacterium]|nr:hypothetical protein [Clostridia bacterium]
MLFDNLKSSIARDPVGRVAEVATEIAFVRARTDLFGKITEALESGRIPTRICRALRRSFKKEGSTSWIKAPYEYFLLCCAPP